MAMNVGSTDDGDVMIDINTTPLIDVMLVLIIMLIITIPIQTHAVKLNMPVGTPPPPLTPPEVITIEVDFDGTLIWNGQVLASRKELEPRLRAAAAQQIQPEVHLRPNKLAKYEHVALVMASAQRLGITKLGLIGQEQGSTPAPPFDLVRQVQTDSPAEESFHRAQKPESVVRLFDEHLVGRYLNHVHVPALVVSASSSASA